MLRLPRFEIPPRKIGSFTRIVACLGGLGFAVIGVLAFRDSNWVGTIDMVAATALFLLSSFYGVDLVDDRPAGRRSSRRHRK